MTLANLDMLVERGFSGSFKVTLLTRISLLLEVHLVDVGAEALLARGLEATHGATETVRDLLVPTGQGKGDDTYWMFFLFKWTPLMCSTKDISCLGLN